MIAVDRLSGSGLRDLSRPSVVGHVTSATDSRSRVTRQTALLFSGDEMGSGNDIVGHGAVDVGQAEVAA